MTATRSPRPQATRRSAKVLVGALALTMTLLAAGCRSTDVTQADLVLPPDEGTLLPLGVGMVSDRYSGEVWVRGTTAYTTTWGTRGGRQGNAVKIWDVSNATPRLVDSVLVSGASTLGDVQTSDDGTLLAVAIEYAPNGGLALYSLANPRAPQFVRQYTSNNLRWGVHTAEIARVNGRLYAFCSVDPASGVDAQLVIVDITDPANPVEVSALPIGYPFVHDVFVRDGLLFAAEWSRGLAIYDIGASSGSPADPRFVSRVFTAGGQVHNVWWFHDPQTGDKRYAFVGEEGPGVIGSSSQGDIHVVDLSDLSRPREVAYYRVNGAGTHNFSMDESRGVLYAAYYNAGVMAIDARGNLGDCDDSRRHSDGRCMLHLEPERLLAKQSTATPVYVWGVHWVDNSVYATDMLSGLYRFAAITRE